MSGVIPGKDRRLSNCNHGHVPMFIYPVSKSQFLKFCLCSEPKLGRQFGKAEWFSRRFENIPFGPSGIRGKGRHVFFFEASCRIYNLPVYWLFAWRIVIGGSGGAWVKIPSATIKSGRGNNKCELSPPDKRDGLFPLCFPSCKATCNGH